MCVYCWIEEGRPCVDNDRVRLAVKAINELNDCFGYLHIVLDDMNTEDSDVQDVIDNIKMNKANHTNDFLKKEQACVQLLQNLSKEERLSAIAFNEGWA